MKTVRLYSAGFFLLWLSACLPASRPRPSPTVQATDIATALQVPVSSATLPPPTALPAAGETESAQSTADPVTPTEESFFSAPESPPDFQAIQLQLLENSRLRRRDITYCTTEGVELKLDFFLPLSPTGPAPLVILVHGGGWSEGQKRVSEGLIDAPSLLAAGFAFASLDYRLAPEFTFPAMIQDVRCAVRHFRANASVYRIDPQRIGIFGPSAGGHLSILTGLANEVPAFDSAQYPDQSSRVQAVVDLYGPADLTTAVSPTFMELKPRVFPDFDLALASPVKHVSPDDPAFLILHGNLDRVVPLVQSQILYEALSAAGVPVELVVVKNGNHGFSTSNMTPTRAELTQMIVEFFRQHLQ